MTGALASAFSRAYSDMVSTFSHRVMLVPHEGVEEGEEAADPLYDYPEVCNIIDALAREHKFVWADVFWYRSANAQVNEDVPSYEERC